MRLTLLLLFTIVFVTKHAECSWYQNSLFDTVSNKTSLVTEYVKSKGRSIKEFYVDKVHKISSYLGDSQNEINKRPESKQDVIDSKFEEYLRTAQNDNQKMFDAIAPEDMKYECSGDDPSIHMSTPQLIALHGYPAEAHTVLTDDGYLLTVHRIPHTKKAKTKTAARATVLLHHGLLGSSADWVIAGPDKALAYVLSDAGYDVWMANVRGNTYSRAHIKLDTDSFAFWNFTFHEVSQHDLPAVINYMLEVKGWDTKINYVGHSMGTTILFAMLSTKTEYNKILRAGVALAPVGYMSDIKSPLRILARYANKIELLFKLFGANQFLPQNAVLRWLSKHACEINHYEEVICENSMFILCGHDEKQFNRTLLPLILGHVPAGASTKTLVHYAQEIRNNGRFEQFDYGAEGNMQQYGTKDPPRYNISEITLPIAFISAQNDWLASEVDVCNFYQQLRNPIEHYVVPLKEFNHIDFLWAVDAPKLVYKRLIGILEGTVKPVPTGGIYDAGLWVE